MSDDSWIKDYKYVDSYKFKEYYFNILVKLNNQIKYMSQSSYTHKLISKILRNEHIKLRRLIKTDSQQMRLKK